ncbi:exonuclease domain-containing protein [Curtobacterium flaccumfaciens pv. oortii]|uniref:exonuclease domain-containing protein n=1 Tax=Curtobacterium flaccumfaciens TaxID=2035 RepID=UPI0026580418|nr:histone-like nucleoid-structuring protein Lsr2 [Curtobacterium flaccumfaciens]MCS5521196.1 exonuclease domain-containing protein [Curtobacterium flaccumfaciens pv. oortii]
MAPPTPVSFRVGKVPAFAVIDVETTGLSPQRDRILELAIVRLDESGAVVDEWVSRFDPEGPVGATHIHGITQADVVGQPRFADVASTVMAALSGLAVVAHNAKFDLAFLRNELKAAGWSVPWIAAYCTLDASYAYLPDMDRRRLVDCCWAVGVRLDDAHSALGDARAAAGLLGAYVTVNGGPDPVLVEALAATRGTEWPASPIRQPLTAEQRVAGGSARARPMRITPPKPTSPPLLRQLTGMSLLEVIEEGAPVGTTAYVEMLFDALEDGDISDAEADALQELVAEFELSPADVYAAHEAFLLALAHRAVDDGRVSHDERRELRTVASLLGVADGKVKQVLDRADAARHARLSAGLGPLPDPWPHGEPLRVGDRIVFTGCDETQRSRLEQRAEELGVRVIGAVSRLTVMLITDGSFSGGKAAKAKQFGTRHVHPDAFEVLLQHLQPAARQATLPGPPPVAQIPGGTAPRRADASPSSIRAWAVASGYEVGVRGRLPKHIIDAYAAAQQ